MQTIMRSSGFFPLKKRTHIDVIRPLTIDKYINYINLHRHEDIEQAVF